MSRSNRSIWPPKWTTTRKFEHRPKGEIGVLEDVLRNGRRCFLIIRHDARTYMGGLTFNNAESCDKICEFIKKHTGLSLKEIGDLEIPFT
jgi:hypothetical protein